MAHDEAKKPLNYDQRKICTEEQENYFHKYIFYNKKKVVFWFCANVVLIFKNALYKSRCTCVGVCVLLSVLPQA